MTRPNWFIGIPVPPGGWFDSLRKPPPRVRLFHPDELHITVAFLGGVGEAAARQAWVSAKDWPLGRLTVSMSHVASLGNPRAPSFSALIDEGNQALVDAMAVVRGAMWKAAGARTERRAPLPHCTLARVNRRASEHEVRAARAWADELAVGGVTVEVDGLALYTWAEDRRSRLFRVVARTRA